MKDEIAVEIDLKISRKSHGIVKEKRGKFSEEKHVKFNLTFFYFYFIYRSFAR